MANNSLTTERLPTMELNKLSVMIITAIVTLGIAVGGWCYQNGRMNNKIDNLEKQSIVRIQENKEDFMILKSDLKTEIRELDEDKADKDVVQLFLRKVENIDSKLDRLIENNKK